ncbi:hypothetical protein ACJ73_05220 [Blastomyces percursus]|uniref:Ankyrin repeat protein n=1 Tax=Blastomyces percursus TaxID=1658174 RepID=A0A1J9QT74_9EURO|nr:hypothetical protein ACJ73_05220 [Blastomyces percursus]
MTAVSVGCVQTVDFLIKSGPAVNPFPRGRWGTPLALAAFTGHKNAGAYVNMEIEAGMCNSAPAATACDSLDMVKLLIKQEAEINLSHLSERKSILETTRFAHLPKLVDFLIESGAKEKYQINIRDYDIYPAF